MTAPTLPPRRPVVHLYVIVDKNDPNPQTPAPIGVGLTRADCRKLITFDPNADSYRIKRARATLYES